MTRFADAGLVAFGLLAGTSYLVPTATFVPGGTRQVNSPQLRGPSDADRELEFQAFDQRAGVAAEPAAAQSVGLGHVLAIAAAFGLVAGIATHPASAAMGEDDTPSVRKTKRKKPAAKVVKEEEPASAGFSFPNPFGGGGEKSTVAMVASNGTYGSAAVESRAPNGKIYINPSDDLDEDELDFDQWTERNPLLLLLGLTTPSIIYLFFYVAGSLEII